MYLTHVKSTHLRLMDIGRYTPARIHIPLILGIVTNVLGVLLYGTSLWNESVTMFNTIPLAAFLWIVLTKTFRKLAEVDFVLAGLFFCYPAGIRSAIWSVPWRYCRSAAPDGPGCNFSATAPSMGGA